MINLSSICHAYPSSTLVHFYTIITHSSMRTYFIVLSMRIKNVSSRLHELTVGRYPSSTLVHFYTIITHSSMRTYFIVLSMRIKNVSSRLHELTVGRSEFLHLQR